MYAKQHQDVVFVEMLAFIHSFITGNFNPNLPKGFEATFEPVHEKTNNLGFRPGPTQTRLYSHRSRLEA